MSWDITPVLDSAQGATPIISSGKNKTPIKHNDQNRIGPVSCHAKRISSGAKLADLKSLRYTQKIINSIWEEFLPSYRLINSNSGFPVYMPAAKRREMRRDILARFGSKLKERFPKAIEIEVHYREHELRYYLKFPKGKIISGIV